jgi:hypothetical protein
MVQAAGVADASQVQPVPDIAVTVMPAGTASVTDTFRATDGPAFSIVSV